MKRGFFMKIILIIALLFFAGCSYENKSMEDKENPQKNVSKKAEIVETEIPIGQATTDIIDKGKNRVDNISVACEKINGTEVKAGEVFSFNSTTGERNVKNGYKNAPVIVDGEKSYGIGGGVCQVSTTIYMAALTANLSIIEHFNHSEPVAYAPKGKDATVVYGVKDLKIKNDTDKSIFIYAWVEDEKVFSKIIQKSIDIQ